ncbi:hypothetical protein H310_09915 [Aphanomyces invadans]|uniref:Uncharacterized protein n=1 Tax=Aphanomyces invadans TaxID=157072 RepID=A0A024TTZ4_9STRA|nr:hypothetical protein H310_09915 [Aphanomyces invadans]ETV97106.1 hypothetical protein H310_09915 [Aphanomyces invadans]|eukprot:XP_008874352.1 hypothetical protein H310_09915 [Aphanomyces invadans]
MRFQCGVEVRNLLAARGLDFHAQLDSAVEEFGHTHKIGFLETTRSQGGRADANTTGRDGAAVTQDRVLVERDTSDIAELFHLRTGDTSGAQVPQEQVVVGATSREDVPLVRQRFGQRTAIGLDLDGVLLEFGGRNFLQLSSNGSDLVLMRTALETREHSLVDLGFKVARVLAVEDHAGAGTAKRLVGCRRHDVAELERALVFAGGNQPRVVRHIAHEQRAVVVCDLAERRVVPVTGVGTATAYNEGRLEKGSGFGQLFEVDQSSFGVHTVGQTFKVHRRGRHGLAGVFSLAVRVEPMGQMATTGQVQTHDAVVGTKQRRVHSKVGGRPRVWLDVHAPFLRVQAVCLQCTVLAELFDLVNHFVPAVVALVYVAFGVLVGQARSQAVHDGTRREVFGRNQLQALPLAVLFMFNQVEQLRVVVFQGSVAGREAHVVRLTQMG